MDIISTLLTAVQIHFENIIREGRWEVRGCGGLGREGRGEEGPTICFLNLYSFLLSVPPLGYERVNSIKVNNNYQLQDTLVAVLRLSLCYHRVISDEQRLADMCYTTKWKLRKVFEKKAFLLKAGNRKEVL